MDHDPQYPNGKLNEDDNGALTIAVGTEGDVVCVYFGKPIAWFGMPAQDARNLAQTLIQHADAIETSQKGKACRKLN
jgi:hypothetical protein